MEIQVSLFRECDVDTVFLIQQAAFKPLYEKYHDDSSNPYMETEKTVYQKYTREGTVGYLITLDDKAVGAVRINTDHAKKAVAFLPYVFCRSIRAGELHRRHCWKSRDYILTLSAGFWIL